MKKSEDYLKPYRKYLVEGIDGYKNISGDGMFIGDVEDAIKQAQIDAIEETCRVCAENADLTYVECEWEIPEGTVSVGDSEYGYNYIDKQSILSVADKLKKELE